jgi:hypothetical protein
MAVMVKGALLGLLTMKVRSVFCPRHAMPKSSVRVETLQVTGGTQVPVRFTVLQLIGPQALLVMKLSVPLCIPAAAQLNRTVTVTGLPGLTNTGNDGLTTVNAPLLEFMVLIVNGILPELFTVNDCCEF